MTGVLPATMRSPMSRVGRFRPTESGEGLRMDGRVLTKERCICGGRFGRVIEDRRVEGWFDSELRCADCGRRPGRYFLRLSGLKIYREPKSGEPLATWRQAFRLLEKIRGEKQSRTFDRTEYAAKDVREYRLGNWLRSWLEWQAGLVAQGLMAPLTVRQRRSTVRRWIEPRLGVVDLRDIRQEHVDRFAASLPSKGAGVAGVAEGTRRAIVSVLMTALRQAERWGRIEKAPSMPRLPAAVPRWRWISREMQERVLAAMPERHRPIFAFLVYQMCRPCEARGLRWGDVEFEGGVPRRVTLRGVVHQGVYRARTKTGRQTTAPLLGCVAETLRRIKPDLCPATWYVFQMAGSRAPAGDASGAAYRETAMRWQWRRACERAGAPAISLYAGTRHSSATAARRRGVSLDDIGAVLGHTSARHTQVYAHPDEGRMLRALGEHEVLELRRGKESEG